MVRQSQFRNRYSQAARRRQLYLEPLECRRVLAATVSEDVGTVETSVDPRPDLSVFVLDITFHDPATGRDINPGDDAIPVGELIEVQATVRNIGGEASPPDVQVEFFDTRVDSIPIVPLGTSLIPSIAAGEFHVVQTSFVGSVEGPHALGIRVDPADALVEENELNNGAARGFSVSSTGVVELPMLEQLFDVQTVSGTNANGVTIAEPGEVIELRGRADYVPFIPFDPTGDLGIAGTKGAEVSLALLDQLANPVIARGPLGEVALPASGDSGAFRALHTIGMVPGTDQSAVGQYPNRSTSDSWSFLAPEIPGQYTVRAVVTDGASSSFTEVPLIIIPVADPSPWKDPRGPNFVVRDATGEVINVNVDIAAEGPVVYDQPVPISVRIHNHGNGRLIEPVEVRLESDQGAVLETDFDTTGDTITIPNGAADPIEPGGFKEATFTWTPRHDLEVRQLIVVVDPSDVLQESNESNNVTDRSLADIRVRNLFVDLTPNFGNVRFSVENAEDTPDGAVPFAVPSFFADLSIQRPDGTTQTMSGLGPFSGTGTFTAAMGLSFEQVGTYSITITADPTRPSAPGGNVPETDEQNNDRSETFVIEDPTAVIVASPTSVGCNEAVNFDASQSMHSNPLVTIETYQWDFDFDGTFEADLETAESETAFNYLRAGDHETAVRVVDSNGRSDVASTTINVDFLNLPPISDAGGPYVSVNATPITLDGSSSSDPNAPCDAITGFEWDIDYEGNPDDFDSDLTGAVIADFADPTWFAGEIRPIALRVTDEAGNTSISETTITIDFAPPDLSVSADDILFVEKNGDPAPFHQADVGDTIIVQASVRNAAEAGPATHVEGRVFIDLGFDRIDLGSFAIPRINPGEILPIDLIPNLSLPSPPDPLLGGRFEWVVTAPSPWLHVFTWEVSESEPGDSDPSNNAASRALTVGLPDPVQNSPRLGGNSLVQLDVTMPIEVGGNAGGDTVIFRAAAADIDPNDQVRLEVEVKPLGVPFDATSTAVGPLVAPAFGANVEVEIPSFVDGGYHWRARAVDSGGSTSDWIAFGRNFESEADFFIGANRPPDPPSDALQFDFGRSLPMGIGDTTNVPAFEARVTPTDVDGDDVRVQVEVRPVGTPLTGSPATQSPPISSGEKAKVAVVNLPGTPQGYHWQARVVDSFGAPSPWVSFGGNPESDPDFIVDTTPPAPTPVLPDPPIIVPTPLPDGFFRWAGGSGDWTDPNNWIGAPSQFPGSDIGHTAIVDRPDSHVVLPALPDGFFPISRLQIQNGGELALGGPAADSFTFQAEVIVLDGESTRIIVDDANTSGTSIEIATDRLTVGAGAAITADGLGYAGGGRRGDGNGPGGGIFLGGRSGLGSGGGYGGIGGSEGAQGGASYGDLVDPTDVGSGGAGGRRGVGGAGGGRIRIDATTSVFIDGRITVNGSDAEHPSAGGGSGGTLRVTTSSLGGTGLMRANGGSGEPERSGGAGSGAGGRVLLDLTNNDFTGTVEASGGEAAAGLGGAGTIYLPGSGELTVRNNGAGSATPVPDGSYNLTGLTLDGGARLELDAGDELRVERGAVIHGAASSLVVDQGALIMDRGARYELNGDLILIPGSYQFGAASTGNGFAFTVGPGGTARLGGQPLVATDLRLRSGGLVIPSAPLIPIDINAGSIQIDVGGRIDADGFGFEGGHRRQDGQGPGGGMAVKQNGSGGGHGGRGGSAGDAIGGGIYGSLTEPNDFGSGGAGGQQQAGTAGGGIIRLVADATLSLQGTVSADGAHQDLARAGAGSGGSLYVTAGTLTGSGLLRANGGSAAPNPETAGGAGGGGRMAIEVDLLTFDGTLSAQGGGGANPGGAGSIYVVDTTLPRFTRLIFDNGGATGATTELGETLSVDNLTLDGGARLGLRASDSLTVTSSATQAASTSLMVGGSLTLGESSSFSTAGRLTIDPGGSFRGEGRSTLVLQGGSVWETDDIVNTYGAVRVRSGAEIRPRVGAHSVLLDVESLTLDASAVINVDGRGFDGGSTRSSGEGPGGGSPSQGGCSSNRRGGGGGYGGVGGSTLGDGRGGTPYGSATNPIDFGSGGAGGGCRGDLGGAGGGRVEIVVAGPLNNNGTISANGSNSPTTRSGGGAGGAIWARAGQLSGNGVIRANGGTATGSSPGGGGGGGRVAIDVDMNDFTGVVETRGGAGTLPGSDGSIVQTGGSNPVTQSLVMAPVANALPSDTINSRSHSDVITHGNRDAFGPGKIWPTSVAGGVPQVAHQPTDDKGQGEVNDEELRIEAIDRYFILLGKSAGLRMLAEADG